MAFSSEHLAQHLDLPNAPQRIWVAYSGGVDSHCLLHALAALSPRHPALDLNAVHVHHGLSLNADAWAAHCRAVCAQLQIPIQLIHVDAKPANGQSPEAAAREARYAALRRIVQPGDWLLTAHHQDDQAETLLLQLLRGSGVKGLAGMPARSAFAQGLLLRPLLDFSRAELEDYARAQGLRWVEDESNLFRGYDRNFLRHELVPLLRERWPAAQALFARTARHCAEAAELLDELARLDLQAILAEDSQTIHIPALLALSESRQRNALRGWITAAGFRLPETAQLEQIQRNVLHAAWDATPCVRCGAAEVRRYRDGLYLMKALAPHDPAQRIAWDMTQPLALPQLDVGLVAKADVGKGLAQARLTGAHITVRFRQGGEHCRPVGRAHHHDLKKLFQEAGVPPWRRDRIPLIFVDDRLAQVVGHWVDEAFAAKPGEPSIDIVSEG
ncbi:MAG: tRNA lysidine(34) synthetase TilS [Pseudomonadota bacterium]